MINAITEAIAVSLDAEFGDAYTIIRETNKQDLKEPCFFIACLNPTIKPVVGERYFRTNQFCIQYFPESQNVNAECHAVAERMLSCIEYITASGDLMHGTAMNYEIVDDVLNFFVNYDCYVRKKNDGTPMETMENHISMKG